MNSLRLHMLATAAALVATCAIASAPAMAAAPAREAAHAAAALNNYGKYFDHADFKPIQAAH